MLQLINRYLAYASLACFIWRAALTTFPLVMMPTFVTRNWVNKTRNHNRYNLLRGNKWSLTSFPSASTTGSRRYFVSSNILTLNVWGEKLTGKNTEKRQKDQRKRYRQNLAASSRFVVSRTTTGAGVIKSPTTCPLVLLSNFCTSLKVCKIIVNMYVYHQVLPRQIWKTVSLYISSSSSSKSASWIPHITDGTREGLMGAVVTTDF